MTTDQDLIDCYRATKEGLAATLDSVDSRALATPVPECPGWTVRDTFAHHIGVVADLLQGVVFADAFEMFLPDDDVASAARHRNAAWTQSHIDQRRAASLVELASEWESVTDQLEAVLTGAAPQPETADSLRIAPVMDAFTHLGDIAGALGTPINPAPADVAVPLRVAYDGLLSPHLALNELDPLRLVATHIDLDIGPTESMVSVAGTAYELFRAITSRRSESQVRSLQWEGPAADHQACLGTWTPQPTDRRS